MYGVTAFVKSGNLRGIVLQRLWLFYLALLPTEPTFLRTKPCPWHVLFYTAPPAAFWCGFSKNSWRVFCDSVKSCRSCNFNLPHHLLQCNPIIVSGFALRPFLISPAISNFPNGLSIQL